ncbi:MAG: hypothetical protein ACI9VR_002330 [Cognaticolwellia sp.]|jgi:hypothetical protein
MRTSLRLAPGLLLLAIAATACTPNEVEVDGTYHVWLAANSSASIAEGAVGIGQAPIIDCYNTLDLDREIDERIEGSKCDVAVDENGQLPNQTGLLPSYESELYDYIQPTAYQGPFGWLMNDAFYLKEDKFEPWRSEAVMTSEGDFQVTLHQRLGNGEDFRIAFVIDPQFQPKECIQSGETCYTLDGEPQDEDGDGWFDEADPDCVFGGYEAGYSSLAPLELLDCTGVCDCNDSIDNDADGDVDADDVDCSSGFDDNESSDVSCEDGEDNDGDSWTDFADPDCSFDGSENGNFTVTQCNDGVDNDGDGDMDNDDASCGDALDTIEGSAGPRTSNDCTDKTDNDDDGWVDSDDPDCGLYGDESGWTLLECNDGIDNDFDGDVDVDDVGCSEATATEDELDVTCTDGDDNDGDGYSDEDDPDCILGLVEDDSFFGVYGCNDGIDNDRDDDVGEDEPDDVEITIDSADSDCKSAFQGLEETAVSLSCTDTDGFDEDADGWVNEEDPDCFDGGKVERFFAGGACNDGIDNDGDALVDSADPGCIDAARVTEDDLPLGSDCDDGVDNDGDSWIDLDDDGCQLIGLEFTVETTDCSDGLDNDADGDIDSADLDCANSLDVDELTNDTCADGLDNDGDGWVDLEDLDCSDLGYERGFDTGECSDGLDNDGDGDVDAADAECLNAGTRLERPDQCSDSIDNDADGYMDIEDPDCFLSANGLEDGAVDNAQCNNGADDDGDGAIDSLDSECTNALDNLEQLDDPGEPRLISYGQADWIAEMSADEDGDIYYLNAGAYQVNPNDNDQVWTLPQEWLSGFAAARFASDNFSSVGTGDFDYVYELDIPDSVGTYTVFTATDEFYSEFAEEARAQSDWWSSNAQAWTGMDYEGFNFRVEDNDWRSRDSLTTGLDSWVYRSPNYVIINDGSTLEEGGSATGEFQIHMVSFDSASAMIVQGTFKVPEIGGDKWTYGSLEEELIERNETEICGQTDPI